jgi:hypothetical protein
VIHTSVCGGAGGLLRVLSHFFIVFSFKEVIVTISAVGSVLAVVDEIEECAWRRLL